MPERPDLRDIAANIAESLGDFDRDQLLDVLTYVFKEYVVEGPPPMLAGPSERVADLEGLSFAQLVQTLQTRLDVPELALFQVEGERVSVRVGGVLQQLDAASAGSRGANITEQTSAVPTRPAEPAPPAPQVPRQPTGRETADEAIARGRGDLAGHAGAATRPAPRPTAGGSVRGQPRATEPQPAPPAAATPEPAKHDEPASDDDASSIRFSLLELD